MNIGFKFAPKEYTNWDLTRKFSDILHSGDFAPKKEGERKINFQIELNPSLAGGVGSDGSGTLTVPSAKIGNKLLEHLENKPLKIDNKKLKFFRKRPPPKGLALTLERTRYVDPNNEEDRQKTLDSLEALRVNFVQFGIFYRPTYPKKDAEPPCPLEFSVEWEGNYVSHSNGKLNFDYDRKLIRITLGSELTDKTGYNLAINFSSIQEIYVGHDPKPYICFDTLTPPVMETYNFHRPMTGVKKTDTRKFKQRISSLDESHSIVAPYARQLRVVLQGPDMIKKFLHMSEKVGIASSVIHQCEIEAFKKFFFTPRRLHKVHRKLAMMEWSVAFQLESMLCNGLLHTGDIEDLLPQVEELCQIDTQERGYSVDDLLRRYQEALKDRAPHESPLKILKLLQKGFQGYSNPHGTFRCCHVTFTPTRMILEGPYATQSNRVIRQYEEHEDHFIRVDFRDEDRLQYRWDREVDGTSFLRDRVGTILKEGFSLAGRKFEFLAYSNSALHEHVVWFMNRFDSGRGLITPDSIRRSLGNFEGTKLLRCPSKYAARLAQAFTATDPSVTIRRNEWEEVPDLGSEPYLFTDGVGTISQKLADKIFKELFNDWQNSMTPSAYQIRFLGYKGVVVIDAQLDKDPRGIQMRLRPSMRKFETMDNDVAPIEIAQAFRRPGPCHLNQPLVMLLEDVGVKKEVFQELQDLAVKQARTLDDSILQFNEVLVAHRLGSGYSLSQIMGRLQDRCNMDWKSDGGRTVSMDNPFFSQLRQVAMNHVLRDIRHSARIPVPNSFVLVGVADEGPAYEAAEGRKVFKLKESQIYACIQKGHDQEPIWLEGIVSISRSPIVNLGDVQRVYAIGKPPEDMLCLFSHLKNVVVLPSVGERSLASCLGGGDVDGDLFSVICYDPLLPATFESAAEYESCGTYELDRDTTVEDICDFIVEYIHSDVLGLLSNRLLVIADQSINGMRDEACIQLAKLCSQAVDYPKQGIPVNLDDNTLPPTLIRCKPDWHSESDNYKSDRALGFLFRSIGDLRPIPVLLPVQSLSDPITERLLESVQRHLGDSATVNSHPLVLRNIFRHYADELRYICATHTLSDAPGVRISEAEVVIGTILAKCSQSRWRKNRIYRMHHHASVLVRDIQRDLKEHVENTVSTSEEPEPIAGLRLAWSAWDLSLKLSCENDCENEFAANSFGLIALGMVFDYLDAIELREPKGVGL